MADVKISELPAADQANVDDLLEASQVSGPGYVTRRISLDQVSSLVAASDQVQGEIDDAIGALPPPVSDWADITGKPATFPPTLPIPESGVTNLVSDLALKAPIASPTFTGDPKAPTPATADDDTSIATTAYVKANLAALSTTPSGAAGGDLAGSYPNPLIKPSVTNGQVLTTTAGVAGWAAPTGGGGAGTVTSVSVVSANGLAGTVATPTATPAITLSTTITGMLKGNGTAISAGTAGTDYMTPGNVSAAYQPLDADLTALAGLNATAGLVEQTGAAAFTKRLLGVSASTSVPTRADADTRYLPAVSTTAPGSPTDGQLWFFTDASVGGGNLYIRYNDGSSTAWVPASTATAGSVVQTVSFQTGAVATGTTIIPYDDTIPQITEGNEYMTLAITPRSATSRLIIEVLWNGYNDAASATQLTVALFQDSAANALAAVAPTNGTGFASTITLKHTMVSGTTSPTTFRVRVGAATGSTTTTFNGVSGLRRMGGVMASSIVISEVL